MTDTEAQPVAWMYEHRIADKQLIQPNRANMNRRYWTETPLYAHPPADTLASHQRERDQTVELVKQAVDIFTYCTVEDGVCCCGDYMDKHSNPMSCGHSPVDHGSYVAGRWREDARAALASIGEPT